jgi:peptide/nickel transport system permease protein
MAGILAFFALVVVGLFGERIAPFEPIFFVVEHGNDPRPYDPGVVFPFGSDVLGRDLLSVVLAGARATLTIVLLAGLGRVVAGVLIAALASRWRATGPVIETVAQLASAVPATLVALLLMKAFVKTDTTIPVFIGALLVMGWAGPYRVIRAEVDRLASAPFTQGAIALGVGRWRILWRHQLPHLAPVIALNLSQQVVASLVLVAELGVLGVLVGAVRTLNVEESQTAIRIGPPMVALVPDTPEWGAMLASSRTVEALWTTRWLIFVPGVAIALTAIAVAVTGFALARRYARRDFLEDRRGAAAFALALVAVFGASTVIPERYAEARQWSADARSGLRPAASMASEFEAAGLRTYAAVREVVTVARSGPATVAIGQASVAEVYPRPIDPPPNTIHVQSLVGAGTGGGVVEAPLVFAARGIVPSSPALAQLGRTQSTRPTGPSLAQLVKDYPDDYAGIDVRGKVVLLVQFVGVDARELGYVSGLSVHDNISSAITRGAAAVVFVDPALGSYRDSQSSSGLQSARGPLNPYLAIEREFPPARTSGVPVVVLSPAAAQTLTLPLGLDLSPFLGFDALGMKWERSEARDLGVGARIEVPLRPDTVRVPSLIGEVPDVADEAGRVVVFAARTLGSSELEPERAAVLATMARFAAARRVPFIFVDLDPQADARAVRDAVGHRRVVLVIVIDELDGSVLRFETVNGDLIPAFDLYAQKAGARSEVTRRTAVPTQVLEPFPGVKTVAINAEDVAGDVRADAVAVIAYLAGRLALGAPELPR